jgi:hypothetical protein
MDSFFFAKNMPRLGSNLQFSSDKSTSQEQPIETDVSEMTTAKHLHLCHEFRQQYTVARMKQTM